MKLVALKFEFEFTSFHTLQSTIKSTFRYFKWMWTIKPTFMPEFIFFSHFRTAELRWCYSHSDGLVCTHVSNYNTNNSRHRRAVYCDRLPVSSNVKI